MADCPSFVDDREGVALVVFKRAMTVGTFGEVGIPFQQITAP
ncbi:MAG TPA: hypothetical protein VEK08_15480 [Planctomycetota bacterium]|nr:hypothetical protein [Planctomycetota bacterium]